MENDKEVETLKKELKELKSRLEFRSDNSNVAVKKNEPSSLFVRKYNITMLAILSVFLNSLFLALWVSFQYVLQLLVFTLNIQGVGSWFLLTFQVIFGISTLVPILFNVYRDLRVMWVRINKEISKEKNQEACQF